MQPEAAIKWYNIQVAKPRNPSIDPNAENDD